MAVEPRPDLTDAKFSFGDGFGNEFVGRDSLQLKIVAVDPQKGVGRSQADSFIAIEKGMVVRERLHESRGFVNEVVVVPVLRTEDGRFKQAMVAKAVNAAKFVDELAVHFHGFRHGQIDVARREIVLRWHRAYFARS